MKTLNKEEVKILAVNLLMTEDEAQEVADIFARILKEEQGGKSGWKIKLQLNSVDDYIEEWENHWHREANWEDYYSYEKEACYSDYDEAETIFESLETFKRYVRMYRFAYELSCSDMIIIVC